MDRGHLRTRVGRGDRQELDRGSDGDVLPEPDGRSPSNRDHGLRGRGDHEIPSSLDILDRDVGVDLIDSCRQSIAQLIRQEISLMDRRTTGDDHHPSCPESVQLGRHFQHRPGPKHHAPSESVVDESVHLR